MQCPACKNTSLLPGKLEQGLPAMVCKQCGGAYISILYYRDWIKRNPVEETAQFSTAQETGVDDNHAALNCPKCGRIMTKYRITGDLTNRLDLCAFCGEAWLDGGEWTLLKALELSHQLPAVFTDTWQHEVRREVREKDRTERYLKILGEENLLKAEQIRKWLLKHPKRQDILNYLSHDG